MSTLTTPVEIDTELARLYYERMKASDRLETLRETAKHYAGAEYYYRGRQRVTDMTHNEAIDILEQAIPLAIAWDEEWQSRDYDQEWRKANPKPVPFNNLSMGYDAPKRAQKLLGEIEEAERKIEDLWVEFKALDDRYTGWSRFFLVTSSAGHVHRSMRCSTCRWSTTYGWITELSGKTEAEAVEALGSNLCSVCFPSAPVEWQGGKFTKAQAEKIADKGLSAVKKAR